MSCGAVAHTSINLVAVSIAGDCIALANSDERFVSPTGRSDVVKIDEPTNGNESIRFLSKFIVFNAFYLTFSRFFSRRLLLLVSHRRLNTNQCTLLYTALLRNTFLLFGASLMPSIVVVFVMKGPERT